MPETSLLNLNVAQHPVRDQAAFDNVIGSYIEYPTRTDALLARLLFTLDIGEDALRKAFSVILDPNFDSKEITLRSVEEHYLYPKRVRDEHLDELGRRSTASVPEVIIDGVLQAIADDIDDAFHVFAFVGRRTFMSRNDVKNLMLVQRNWVLPARRILGRHLRIDPNVMHQSIRCLRHPFTGPWTQQIQMSIAKRNNSWEPLGYHDPNSYINVEHSLLTPQDAFEAHAILQNLATHYSPALRCLSMPLVDTLKPIETIIECFPLLEILRITLPLDVTQANTMLLTIKRLPRLKHLTLHFPHFPPFHQFLDVHWADTPMPGSLRILGSSHSLKTIHYDFSMALKSFRTMHYERRGLKNINGGFLLVGLSFNFSAHRLNASHEDFASVLERLPHPEVEMVQICFPNISQALWDICRCRPSVIKALEWPFLKSATITIVPDQFFRTSIWAASSLDVLALLPTLRSLTLIYDLLNLETLPDADAEGWGKECRECWEVLDCGLVDYVKRSTNTLRYLRVEVNCEDSNFVGNFREEDRGNFDIAKIPRTAAACRESQVFFVLQKQRYHK